MKLCKKPIIRGPSLVLDTETKCSQVNAAISLLASLEFQHVQIPEICVFVEFRLVYSFNYVSNKFLFYFFKF